MHERETVETFDEVLKQNNKEKWFKVNKQATIDWSKTTSHFVGHDKAGEELSRKILTRMKMSAKAVNEISSIVGLHMKMHELPEMKKPHSIRKLIANPFFELTFNLSLSDTVGTV
ncbi:MAG: hypothetical protein LBM93_15215, partial [Oscillospiraceae bacterium]|nr:hypothetical protein [Oscillospiraceae bacterium]